MSEGKLRIYISPQYAEEMRDYIQYVLDNRPLNEVEASGLEHYLRQLDDIIRGRTK